MCAGGMEQADMARAIGIAPHTLRKHFRRELDTGAAEVHARVITSLVDMAAGEPAAPGRRAVPAYFPATKFYLQARCGWQERMLVEDGKPADQPMRVVVELVGDAPAPQTDRRAEYSTPRVGNIAVELKG